MKSLLVCMILICLILASPAIADLYEHESGIIFTSPTSWAWEDGSAHPSDAYWYIVNDMYHLPRMEVAIGELGMTMPSYVSPQMIVRTLGIRNVEVIEHGVVICPRADDMEGMLIVATGSQGVYVDVHVIIFTQGQRLCVARLICERGTSENYKRFFIGLIGIGDGSL